jgi:hypothetical protein
MSHAASWRNVRGLNRIPVMPIFSPASFHFE